MVNLQGIKQDAVRFSVAPAGSNEANDAPTDTELFLDLVVCRGDAANADDGLAGTAIHLPNLDGIVCRPLDLGEAALPSSFSSASNARSPTGTHLS